MQQMQETASKREIQKTAEANKDLIGKKVTNKITNPSSQNVSKTDNTSHKDILIPKEMYISPEKRQKIIDELRLM